MVLCEGGPTWLGELVAAGRLDELCLTIAPLMGGDLLPVSVAPPGAPLAPLRTAPRAARGGDTLFLRYERGADDRDVFGTLMSALDNPLVVVTTAEAGERAGCLVGFHAQSSIEPQRYCVWLSKANHTYRVALRATHLAIHFLTADDLPLAELFGDQTGDTVDKFAGLRVSPGPGGVPVLADCPHWLVARRVALLDEGGDHVCVTHRAGGRAEPAGRSSRSGCPGRAPHARARPPGTARPAD